MKILDTRATRAPAGPDMTLAADTSTSSDHLRLSRIARVFGIAALAAALAACNVSPTPSGEGAASAGEGVRLLEVEIAGDDERGPSTGLLPPADRVELDPDDVSAVDLTHPDGRRRA